MAELTKTLNVFTIVFINYIASQYIGGNSLKASLQMVKLKNDGFSPLFNYIPESEKYAHSVILH